MKTNRLLTALLCFVAWTTVAFAQTGGPFGPSPGNGSAVQPTGWRNLGLGADVTIAPKSVMRVSGGSGYSADNFDIIRLQCPGATLGAGGIAPAIAVSTIGSNGTIINWNLQAPGGPFTGVPPGAAATCTQLSTTGGGTGATFSVVFAPIAAQLSIPLIGNNGNGNLYLVPQSSMSLTNTGTENTFLSWAAGHCLIHASGANTLINGTGLAGVSDSSACPYGAWTGSFNTFIGNDAARNTHGVIGSTTCIGQNTCRNLGYLWTVDGTITGSVVAGDVVQVTATNPNITGFPITVSYTVQGGDTTTLVAAGLAAAINASTPLTSVGTSATNSANVLLVSYPGATTWTSTASPGAEAIAFVVDYQSKTIGNTVVGAQSGGSGAFFCSNGQCGPGLSGPNNSIFGYASGNALTTGFRNTIIGAGSGNTLTTGNYNILIGSSDAVAVDVPAGATSLYINIGNSFILDYANNNMSFTRGALPPWTTGTGNVLMGSGAGAGYGDGTGNTVLGSRAGGANSGTTSAGGGNTYVGYQAGWGRNGDSSTTAIGNNSLPKVAANNNTAVGTNTGASNTTGTRNVYVGVNAGNLVTIGADNTIIGTNVAITRLTTGTHNLLIGAQGSAIDTPAAATSNYMSINAILTTTGTNVPATSISTIAGRLVAPALLTTGTATGSLCIDSSGSVFVKTTSGACV